MSLIIENYKNFFPDVSGKQVHDEWTSIKRLIVKKSSLMLMPFKQLWARMLSMFTAQFPLILRVVAIAMTFTTDTSGCERLTCRQSSKPNGARLPALSDVVIH